MVLADASGLVLGAVALGFVHGIEPGHGWPVAASYALDQSNKWFYGFAASFILGFGHLVSSIAMVAVFFWAKSYFSLTQINEPITVLDGIQVGGLESIQVGGPVSLVAGVLLIGLGIREYFHGHSHDHGGGHSHDHGDHDHGDGHDHGDHDHDHDEGGKFAHAHVDSAGGDHVHDHDDGHDHDHDHGDHDHDHGDHDHGHGDHDHGKPGLLGRLKTFIPFVGGHSHDHDTGSLDEATDRGLWGIAGFAFVLGFAHEEEFEIIAICAGSQYCLELMLIYAATVIFGIVGLTLLLIAGYERSEDKVKEYSKYLPVFSAAVLTIMGIGFIVGIF